MTADWLKDGWRHDTSSDAFIRRIDGLAHEIEFQFYNLESLLVLVFRIRNVAPRRDVPLTVILLFDRTAKDPHANELLPRPMLIYYVVDHSFRE